jgi:hypothetical protein
MLSAASSRVSLVFGMSWRSFRTRCGRSPRRAGPLWPLGLSAALILAGCGGSTTSNVRTVRGAGYSFSAPGGWTIARNGAATTAVNGKVDLLEVLHFTLEKPYRVARFGAVARELDRVAAGLAKQNSGQVVKRATMQVTGRKTRYYEIEYGPGTTEEIAFVLDAKNEYQVLCRRLSAASDASCGQFFASFALSPT